MTTSEEKIALLQKEISDLRADMAFRLTNQKEKDFQDTEFENSQKRFKTIFEDSLLGNKIINNKLEILKVNSALVQLLGYSEKELLGEHITEFSHPDYLKEWETLRLELWHHEKKSFSIETCLIKKNKHTVWCHVTSIRFADNGETWGYTIIEDISERKAKERIAQRLPLKKMSSSVS